MENIKIEILKYKDGSEKNIVFITKEDGSTMSMSKETWAEMQQ